MKLQRCYGTETATDHADALLISPTAAGQQHILHLHCKLVKHGVWYNGTTWTVLVRSQKKEKHATSLPHFQPSHFQLHQTGGRVQSMQHQLATPT